MPFCFASNRPVLRLQSLLSVEGNMVHPALVMVWLHICFSIFVKILSNQGFFGPVVSVPNGLLHAAPTINLPYTWC